jgi:hypothetical protein
VDGHGRPIAGAKLEIFHAADNGDYAGLYDDGVPEYNLRGHRFTDSAGRYSHTTVVSSYADPHITAVEGVAEACAALGRSLYRPAHIHYEVHHPDLITPWAGEIYFKGDPVIPVDFVGGTKAPLSLRAEIVGLCASTRLTGGRPTARLSRTTAVPCFPAAPDHPDAVTAGEGNGPRTGARRRPGCARCPPTPYAYHR